MVKKSTVSILFIFINLFSLIAFSQTNTTTKLQKDEFEFKILYNNDSSETVISEMYDDENTGKPFLFSDCKRIYPEDTKGLVVKNSDGQTFNAIAFGGVWYFENTVGDNLSTYRTRPDLFNKGQFKSIYFRKSNDPTKFIAFSKKNALEAVQDNPKALRKMKGAIFLKDFSTGLIVSGGVLLVPALFVGVFALPIGFTVSLAGVIIRPTSTNTFYKSLKAYNEVAK